MRAGVGFSLALALALALVVPAHGAPFGKPRTLGTTPSAYGYDSFFSADGPGGGVAFFVVGERRTDTKTTQRLYIARVEGSGRVHRLTSTRVDGFEPGRSYDGGPPLAYLAVGPRWRMLTTEVRPTRVHNVQDVYAVRVAPGGRRVGAQRLGSSYDASGILRTNARGDAIATFGDGFTIARAAGRFVRAPASLRERSGLPRLVADGSLYDFETSQAEGLTVRHSRGRRWGRERTVFSGPFGGGVLYRDVVSTTRGRALVVHGNAESVYDSTLTARWGRGGGALGQPVELAPHADPLTVAIETVPGGAFAVRWIEGERDLHLIRARRWGGPFREVARWTAPEDVGFRTMVPLRNGRTVLAWSTRDRESGRRPDRLMAAVIGAGGAVGRTQTLAVGRSLDGFELRRLGAGRRAALVWTEGDGRKRVRIALLRR